MIDILAICWELRDITLIVLLLVMNLAERFIFLADYYIYHCYPFVDLGNVNDVHTVYDEETEELIQIVNPIILLHNDMLILIAHDNKS